MVKMFRNTGCHIPKSSKDIQESLGPHPNGYYQSFDTRFPKLLITTYEAVVKYRGLDFAREYISENYFSEFLPPSLQEAMMRGQQKIKS